MARYLFVSESPKRFYILIFCLFTLLYFSGTRFNLDGYEMEYVLSAMNIFHGGGPRLAPGYYAIPGLNDTDTDAVIYPRQNFLQSYVAVPFYAAGAWLFGENPTSEDIGGVWYVPWGPIFTIAWMNPMAAAGTVLLVILLSMDLGATRRQAHAAALIYGLCSIAWPYAGLGMEVFHTFLLTAALTAAVRYRRTYSSISLFATFLMVSLLPNCKKPSIVFVAPLVFYVSYHVFEKGSRRQKKWIFLLAGLVLAGIMIMLWSLRIKTQVNPEYTDHLINRFQSKITPISDLLFGMTLSPSEGLFVLNPFLVLCLTGWRNSWHFRKRESLLFISILVLLLLLLVRLPYALIDEEWGPRYLHMTLPFLTAAGATSLVRPRAGSIRLAFIALLAACLLIQYLGVLFLGFKTLDAALSTGIQDYTSMVFVPSRSQVVLSAFLFRSAMHRYLTGESLDLSLVVVPTYSGLGGELLEFKSNMASYDQPVGAFYTIRWVLGELGQPVGHEYFMLILQLMTTGFLVAGILELNRRYNQICTASPSAAAAASMTASDSVG